MATQKQIDANRRNALHSTGPRTAEGKAASSMNALKSGLHADSEVLPFEDAEQYQALIARFYADHNPATALECEFLDEIIYCTWILRRLRRTEAQIWEYVHRDALHPDDEFPLAQVAIRSPKTFGQLQWRMDNTRRALDRAVKALRECRTVFPAVPPQPEPIAAPEPEPAPAQQPETVPVNASPASPNPEIGFVPEPRPPAPAPKPEKASGPQPARRPDFPPRLV